jgi:hypothetical protein
LLNQSRFLGSQQLGHRGQSSRLCLLRLDFSLRLTSLLGNRRLDRLSHRRFDLGLRLNSLLCSHGLCSEKLVDGSYFRGYLSRLDLGLRLHSLLGNRRLNRLSHHRFDLGLRLNSLLRSHGLCSKKLVDSGYLRGYLRLDLGLRLHSLLGNRRLNRLSHHRFDLGLRLNSLLRSHGLCSKKLVDSGYLRGYLRLDLGLRLHSLLGNGRFGGEQHVDSGRFRRHLDLRLTSLLDFSLRLLWLPSPENLGDGLGLA